MEKYTDTDLIAWIDNCWSIKDTPQAKAIRDRLASLTAMEKAARKMWWALNSLIPCVLNHDRQCDVARKAMEGWEVIDADPEDWS